MVRGVTTEVVESAADTFLVGLTSGRKRPGWDGRGSSVYAVYHSYIDGRGASERLASLLSEPDGKDDRSSE